MKYSRTFVAIRIVVLVFALFGVFWVMQTVKSPEFTQKANIIFFGFDGQKGR